ncbi:MAG: cadherin-like domain-containing protein [Anaerolineae bacterium]|nr:cadherin-like domain-containing protein [Anaerolineae bacterium]
MKYRVVLVLTIVLISGLVLAQPAFAQEACPNFAPPVYDTHPPFTFPVAGSGSINQPVHCDDTLPTFPAPISTSGSYTAAAFPGMALYVLVYTPQEPFPKYYPQGSYDSVTCSDSSIKGVDVTGNDWAVTSYLGRPGMPEEFHLILVATEAGGEADQAFRLWLKTGCETQRDEPANVCQFPGFVRAPIPPDQCPHPLLPDTGIIELDAIRVRTQTDTPVVNQPPVAVDDDFYTPLNTPLTVRLEDILANDSDPDGDPLTIVEAVPNTAVHGTAAINPDGSVTYTPAQDFVGTISGTYTISDGRGGTASAAVRLTVGGAGNPPAINQPPQAGDDFFTTTAGVALTMTREDLLGNDSDPEGDSLEFVDGTLPAHGRLTPNGRLSVTYTPEAGFTGTDSFSYTISDGHQGTATAVVTITVNPGK